MKLFGRQNNEGFTLIEVIITIVMAGILAVMMFTCSNTSYTKSSSLLAKSTDTFKLQKVMENIFTDYKVICQTSTAWQATHAYVLDDKVFPKATAAQNSRYYLCTTPGTSSSNEPTWPTAIGATVADGGVIWREGLQTKIGEEGTTCNSGPTTCVYGQYTVIDNHFIKFVDNGNDKAEAPIDVGDPQNILKVSIKNDAGGTLTILLTRIITQ